MTQTGEWVRRVAARIVGPTAMQRIVDPVLADMQAEHAEAVRRNRTWRGRAIQVAGYWALLKTLAVYGTLNATGLWRAVTADEHQSVQSLLNASLLGCLGSALVWIALPAIHAIASHDPMANLVFVLPEAIPVGLSAGLMVGILFGLHDRTVSARVLFATMALACAFSVLCLVSWGWLIPAVKLAFESALPAQLHWASPTVLTLRELGQKMADYERSGMTTRYLTFDYYTRVALSCAPAALALFALSVVRFGNVGRLMAAVVAAAAWCSYSVLQIATKSLGWDGLVAPAFAVWLPNAVFVLSALAFSVVRSHRESAVIDLV